MSNWGFNIKPLLCAFGIAGLSLTISGCADVNVPDSRNVNIPAPVTAEERREAINERPDSVMYLPLGEDILVPVELSGGALPTDIVGPFELRAETLAGALQLILADYDVALAFETTEGLTRQITVANLKGRLDQVVSRVCSLADLYCSYEEGSIVIKDTQVFTVALPPIGVDGETAFIDDVITGLTAIVGEDVAAPVSDPTTRTIIYTATQRNSKMAEKYFQRLRANTALVVFETYIWEVSLNSGNSTGINWDEFTTFGKFNTGISVAGNVGANFTNPVSIGLPTTNFIGRDTDPTEFVRFLSQFGAVKTISQPQISVLSGSEAELRVADTENFVSEITTVLSDGGSTTSVTTDSVDTGFTLTIGSSWDKSTVYADVNISLENVNDIENFTFSDGGAAGTSTTIQLPQTSERELDTQIRVRPGDSILIAGLVRESDNFDSRGPGFMEPILPDSRTAETRNLELVFMMRPRVIVYTSGADQRYKNYVQSKMEPLPISNGPLNGASAEVITAPPAPVDPMALPVVPAPVLTPQAPVGQIESVPAPALAVPTVTPPPAVVPEPILREPLVLAPEPAGVAAPILREPLVRVPEPSAVERALQRPLPPPVLSQATDLEQPAIVQLLPIQPVPVQPTPIQPALNAPTAVMPSASAPTRARTVEEILGENTYSLTPPSDPVQQVAPSNTIEVRMPPSEDLQPVVNAPKRNLGASVDFSGQGVAVSSPPQLPENSDQIGGIMIDGSQTSSMNEVRPDLYIEAPAAPSSPQINMRVNDFSASSERYVPFATGGRVSRQAADPQENMRVPSAVSSGSRLGGYTSYGTGQ